MGLTNAYQLYLDNQTVKNKKIPLDVFTISNCSLSIKREDQLHSHISGNKFRKLKYNLLQAQNDQFDRLLTFGGAFSNHIAAVASAGKEFGFKTVGVIRGEELKNKVDLNPTLSFANDCGMQLHFISRKEYRLKRDLNSIKKLQELFGNCYIIPEGGTNDLAIKGCKEILTKTDSEFDYICTSVGTGGTIAGLVESSKAHQTIIGFSALKGNFQISEVKKFTSKKNFKIIDDYCFGGYAKIDLQLIRFINEFKDKTQIQLDPIYTGKMMFGIMDLLKNKKLKENSRILAIHTGGLQGISGMNQLLKKKNLPQINI